MKVEELLPSIIPLYDTSKPWSHWITGSVLFADVSGFTPMSEALSKLGAEGAEILTDILNRYFAEMIEIIHQNGGGVMKFGGDAILCFFEGADALHPCIYAATIMQSRMSKFQSIRTPVRKFDLKMKIGIANGDILLAGVGEPEVRCDYVFAGSAVDLTSDAEHCATAGEIVVKESEELWKIPDLKTEEIGDGFYRVMKTGKPKSKIPSRNNRVSRHVKPLDRSYLIGEIYDLVMEGFHHHVGALLGIVPVFMQFSGFRYTKESFDLFQFHRFFSSIMSITQKYGGRLNRISMGDKGSTFFILFGAPAPLEQREQMAAQWALEVRESIIREFPDISLTFGINTGKVFAGVVGGAGRWEYTVMGDAVNFAARLMQGAINNQICLSSDVEKGIGSRFLLNHLGQRTFKGKSEPLAVYSLDGVRRKRDESISEEKLVGRVDEMEQLRGWIHESREGNPLFVLMRGDPGVGKSFLAEQIILREKGATLQVLIGRGEITQRNHSYAPWIDLIIQRFFKGSPPSPEALDSWLNTEKIEKPYHSWFAEFLGVDMNRDIPECDEETRKNLFHHMMTSLMIRDAKGKPFLIFLDNIHWFDTLSIDLLTALLNHLKNHKVCIIATTRPGIDLEQFRNRKTFREINLKPFTRSESREYAEAILPGEIKEQLLDYIYEHSAGNPFFTGHLLDYLKNTESLQKRMGKWTIGSDALKMKSLSGTDIIVAKISNLPISHQVYLKITSCMGPTFNTDVFKHSLKNEFNPDIFEDLANRGYFFHGGSGFYTFSQTLVQETVYHSIPRKLRIQYHRMIGRAMETCFKDTMDSVLPNVANHFFLSNDRGKAVHYSLAAGKQLHSRLSFSEAEEYFARAHGLLKNSTDERKWDAGFALLDSRTKMGKLLEGLTLARSLKKAVLRKGMRDFYYRACTYQFDLMRRLSRYQFTSTAKKILSRIPPEMAVFRGKLRHLIGSAYFWQGKVDLAEGYFRAVIEGKSEERETEDLLSSYIFLTSIEKKRNRFDEAFKLIDVGLELAKRHNNVHQELRMMIEKAGININSGKPVEAKAILHSVVDMADHYGDYYLMAVITVNLANIEIDLNEYEASLRHLDEAMEIFNSQGVRNGYAECRMLTGIIFYYRNDFTAAYENYLEATTIFEESGEMESTCHGYYNLAEVCLESGRKEEARKWYEKGIRSFNRSDYPGFAGMFDELRLLLNSTAAP